MSKSNRMYSSSPTIKRGGDGSLSIIRPSPATMDHMGLRAQTGDQGENQHEMPIHVVQRHERMDLTHRHLEEHHNLRAQHEMAHSMHDYGEGGSKAELHNRHEAEYRAMHAKHEAERTAMHDRHETGSSIEHKIEGIL